MCYLDAEASVNRFFATGSSVRKLGGIAKSNVLFGQSKSGSSAGDFEAVSNNGSLGIRNTTGNVDVGNSRASFRSRDISDGSSKGIGLGVLGVDLLLFFSGGCFFGGGGLFGWGSLGGHLFGGGGGRLFVLIFFV